MSLASKPSDLNNALPITNLSPIEWGDLKKLLFGLLYFCLMTFGIWTKEMMNVNEIAALNTSFSNGDYDDSVTVISSIATMKAIMCLIIPNLTIFTKCVEACNNPPLILPEDIKIRSPLYFTPESADKRIGETENGRYSLKGAMLEKLQVFCIIVVGSRVTLYVFNLVVFGLTMVFVYYPSVNILLFHCLILAVHSILQGLADATDVSTIMTFHRYHDNVITEPKFEVGGHLLQYNGRWRMRKIINIDIVGLEAEVEVEGNDDDSFVDLTQKLPDSPKSGNSNATPNTPDSKSPTTASSRSSQEMKNMGASNSLVLRGSTQVGNTSGVAL